MLVSQFDEPLLCFRGLKVHLWKTEDIYAMDNALVSLILCLTLCSDGIYSGDTEPHPADCFDLLSFQCPFVDVLTFLQEDQGVLLCQHKPLSCLVCHIAFHRGTMHAVLSLPIPRVAMEVYT